MLQMIHFLFIYLFISLKHETWYSRTVWRPEHEDGVMAKTPHGGNGSHVTFRHKWMMYFALYLSDDNDTICSIINCSGELDKCLCSNSVCQWASTVTHDPWKPLIIISYTLETQPLNPAVVWLGTGSALTRSFAVLGTVSPRDAALVAQLSAHDVGQLDVHLVVAHGAPRVVVQHLHAPLVRFSLIVARQAHLGGRRAGRPALGGRGGPPRLGSSGTGEGQQQQQQQREAQAEGAGHRDWEEGGSAGRGSDHSVLSN